MILMDMEEEIKILKVRWWGGQHGFTIPREVSKKLKLEKDTKVRCLLDTSKRRVIYEVLE